MRKTNKTILIAIILAIMIVMFVVIYTEDRIKINETTKTITQSEIKTETITITKTEIITNLNNQSLVNSPTMTPTITPTEPPRKVTLLGSGATFIYPQIDYWGKLFAQKHPYITIEYSPTGSGTGQTQFLQKLIDFAGSDPPMPRSSWQKAREDPRGILQFPIIVGSVVIVYNIPEIKDAELRLSGEVLSLIYKGEIEYWDDPKIKELNPNLPLPNKKIVAVHRSDSSGTTHIFTLFLHKSAPNIWPKDLVEKAIEWPVDKTGRGIGGKGNQGVSDLVTRTPYSIGYVEYSYAFLAKLPVATIRNVEGEFVRPEPRTMIEALRGSLDMLPPSAKDDFNEFWSSVIYSKGRASYPITSFSFLILYEKYPKDKLTAIRTFVEFILTDGMKNVVEGYVGLPDEIVKYNLANLNLLKEE